MSSTPAGSGGSRQQRAARLREELERTGQSDEDTQTQPGADAPPADSVIREAVPVGQGDHIVRENDCMMSIANRSGFFWETLWDLPENTELKATRGDAKVLLEGDRVTVPEKRRKDEPGATEQLHRFRRKGEPAKLRIRYCEEGEPRAGEPFVVEIDGRQSQQGETDAEGMMDILIPNAAQEGVVRVGAGENETEYVLNIGALGPADTVQGVQQRLKNLGLFDGQADGELGPATEMAIKTFQDLNDLPATGVPDAATSAKLDEVHGS
ncbi:MAG: peptidoglycan-binding protein [bacterium]|nr:peptidoglycan-binding protein [bacterium]